MSEYTPTRNEMLTALVIYRATQREKPPRIEDLATPEQAKRYLGEAERGLAEVERAAAVRALEEAANDLRVSFSRGAAIAMHHQCHKKQCRCGNPGNDEIVRAVFDAAREELRARAEAYRQVRGER